MNLFRRNVRDLAQRRHARCRQGVRKHDGHCHVELVEGSGPELSLQTESLLHIRLRSAALVLCAGSTAFLLKRLLYDSMEGATDPTLVFGDHVLFVLHTVNVTVLALITATLWQRKFVWCTTSLRWFEAAIFGSTTFFFAAAQHYATLFTAKQYGYVDVPIGMWCGLVLVYCLFIPTTPARSSARAAVLTGLRTPASPPARRPVPRCPTRVELCPASPSRRNSPPHPLSSQP